MTLQPEEAKGRVTERHIRESNLIEGIDDPIEDAQSMVAWRYLVECPLLTDTVICRVQDLITVNHLDRRGHYRASGR